MVQLIKVRNPGDVPAEVPGYGILGAGEEAEVRPGPRLDRAVAAGRLELAQAEKTAGKRKSADKE